MEDVPDLPADHELDQVVDGDAFEALEGFHVSAVAENSGGIADVEDFFEPVGNIDDGASLGLQAGDHLEELFGLAHAQTAGRLVKGDDLGVAGQGFGDLHHLPLADGQVGNLGPRIDVLAEVRQAGAALLHQALPLDEAHALGQVAQIQVLRHGQLRHQVEFLVNDRHAGVDGLPRRLEVLNRAAQGQFAAVGLVDAAEDLQQRALARAVLADQGVNARLAHAKN